MESLNDIIIKIALCIVLAGLIGLERELKQKPAGLRTTMLICLGSAVFMIVGINITERYGDIADPARIAAQVVTGIGFLGAGAIIQSRGSVQGLTTAASIWVVASIGLAVGNGYYLMATLATVSVMVVLNLVLFIEKIFTRKNVQRYNIISKSVECVFDALKKTTSFSSLTLEKLEIERRDDKFSFIISCEGKSDIQDKVIKNIAETDGIERIERV